MCLNVQYLIDFRRSHLKSTPWQHTVIRADSHNNKCEWILLLPWMCFRWLYFVHKMYLVFTLVKIYPSWIAVHYSHTARAWTNSRLWARRSEVPSWRQNTDILIPNFLLQSPPSDNVRHQNLGYFCKVLFTKNTHLEAPDWSDRKGGPSCMGGIEKNCWNFQGRERADTCPPISRK